MTPRLAAFVERAVECHETLVGPQVGLVCSDCPRGQRCHEYTDEDGAEHADAIGPASEWGHRCPASWLGTPALIQAAALRELAQVSPLTGWPDDYPAEVVHYSLVLQRAQKARERRHAEQMRREMARSH